MCASCSMPTKIYPQGVPVQVWRATYATHCTGTQVPAQFSLWSELDAERAIEQGVRLAVG